MQGVQPPINNRIHEILNKVCERSVTEGSIRWTEQFPLSLYSHQRALVYEMRERENALRVGIPINNSSTLYSQFGFLGDSESTGKSWTTLAYITACKRQSAPPKPHVLQHMSQLNIFSVERTQQAQTVQNNLIIVPSALLSQWTALFARQNELNYLILRRKNQLNAPDFMEQLPTYDAVIVPHTLYNSLYEKLLPHNYQWTRCFVDDWTSIPLTITRSAICAEFTWLLTGNWYPFFFSTNYIMREELPENSHPDLGKLLINLSQHHLYGGFPSRSLFVQFVNQHPDRHHLIVRTSQSFLKVSLAMIPPRNTLVFYCGDTILRFLLSMNARSLGPILERGDYLRALQKVGTRIISSAEWDTSVSSEFRPTISMDICPICLDRPRIPTITHCCQNVFCADCLFKSCRSNLTTGCPTCRAPIHANQLVAIHDAPRDEQKPFPKKLDVLLQELKSRPNGRHIIYFPAENLYPLLRNALRAEGFRYDVLKGSHIQILKKANQYRNGEINVLVVFSRHALVHIELPQTTTVFIYPDVITEIDKTRIISNCQSIGRTRPLEIVEFLNYEELADAAGPIGAENTSLAESD